MPPDYATDFRDVVSILAEAQSSTADEKSLLLQTFAVGWQMCRVSAHRDIQQADLRELELSEFARAGILPQTFLEAVTVFAQYKLGLVHQALGALTAALIETFNGHEEER